MNSKKKTTLFATSGLFILVGMYNAVVINSESHISSTDVKYPKRIDEIYGVIVPGRQIAGYRAWKKLEPVKFVAKKNVEKENISVKTEVAPTYQPEPTVQNELNLSLVEVINPKKWQKGLSSTQFSGSLSTDQGVIESLSVSLPNGEGVSIAFAEMSGNVFQYDLNGEVFAGLMYQVDQNSYMVTLTNGPLEGTRLRFSAKTEAEQQELIAQSNIETGSFGSEASPEAMIQSDQDLQQEAIQAQGFNFGNGPTL